MVLYVWINWIVTVYAVVLCAFITVVNMECSPSDLVCITWILTVQPVVL